MKVIARASSLVCVLQAFLLAPAFAAQFSQPRARVYGQWTRVTEHADFSPRDTANGAVFQGKLWISHGYPDFVHDLWSSQDGVFWTPVEVETPYEQFSRLVVYDEKLWAINKCGIWSSANGMDWVRVLDEAPFDGWGEAVVNDGKIWVLGNGSEVWWTTDGIKWTCATHNAPFGDRSAPAVAAFNGRLWVIGGSTPAPGKGYGNHEKKGYADIDMNNDVWSSMDGANWTRVTAHAPWRGRMWFAAQAYAGRLWILGGYDNDRYENLGDVWFTTDGRQWHEFESAASWSPRHLPTTYVFEHSLWVTAGNAWPFGNDVWRLRLRGEGQSKDPLQDLEKRDSQSKPHQR